MARLTRGVWVALVVLALMLAACSPEASRARGQPGADINNRDATLELHGTSNPFFKTPGQGQAIAVEKGQ